jgi:cleavage and polyadenylation specificity factor subunit 1
MHALRQEIQPASGVEFATSLKLTPSTLDAHRVLCNVVVARSSLLRIFEVRVEPAPMQAADDERERRTNVRRGTEAVEGEVAMDEQGDGYINIAVSQKMVPTPTVTRLYLIREHRLHGIVTGIEGIKTVSSLDDNLDRLLVSFKDAKIALLEWSDSTHDLETVSIHTYERASQFLALDSPLFHAILRVDPLSRCAALSLPKHALAIVPFSQTQAELDAMDQDQIQVRDIPFSPSFILDLPAKVDQNLRNVIDFVFLPGFNNATVAVLFQTQQTWTGRLKEFKDTVKLIIFTLDNASELYPIITSVDGLPHDSLSLLPCSTSLGGVVIITTNALIYVDQSSRRLALPLNGWTSRLSDIPLLPIAPADETRKLILEGSRSVFVDEKTFFVILKDGAVYPVEIVVDGKTVSKLTMSPPLAQTSIPSVAMNIGNDHIFIGSTVGPSVLLKAAHVEEDMDKDEDKEHSPPAAVVQSDPMDFDDDDIYGTSKVVDSTVANGLVNGHTPLKKLRTVIHLSLRDSLPAYGPIASMAFSLAKNGDRPVPELVAATGSGLLGGFTLFQRDLPVFSKRKVHAIGGARGFWSLPIRQSVKTSGMSYEKPMNPFQSENDTLLLSTDANPSPGFSRVRFFLMTLSVFIRGFY